MRKLPALLSAISLVAVIQACGSADQTEAPARVAGKELSEQQLRLAGFRPIHGTSYLYAPLVSASWSSSYDSDGAGRAKDLLFFDVTTKNAHWLVADSAQRLRSYSVILDPPRTSCWVDRAVDQKSKALGVLFEVVPDPMPKDSTADTHASIGLSTPAGTDPTILIEGVSGLLGHHLVSEESLIVFYNREGELWAVDIAPATRSIRSDSRVSAAPQAQPD